MVNISQMTGMFGKCSDFLRPWGYRVKAARPGLVKLDVTSRAKILYKEPGYSKCRRRFYVTLFACT